MKGDEFISGFSWGVALSTTAFVVLALLWIVG
jgi:hypothetical protein